MSLTWTIIISLVTSIIGGVISGLLMIRKSTHDNKRLYAKQMREDFDLMSTLLFTSARDFLESLGYECKGMDAYKPDEHVKENLFVVNRVRKELDRDEKRKLYKYDAQKVVLKTNELVAEIIHEATGFIPFFGKYHLQASHFDGLYKADSAVDSMIYFADEMPKRSDIEHIRSCVYNIAVYLLDTVSEILKVGSEIAYYSNAKAWTWRLFVPVIRN